MPSRRPWLISFNNKSRGRSNGALTVDTVRIIGSRFVFREGPSLFYFFVYQNFHDEFFSFLFCKSMTSQISFFPFFGSDLSPLRTFAGDIYFRGQASSQSAR